MEDPRFSDQESDPSSEDDQYWSDAMIGVVSLMIFGVVLFAAAFGIDNRPAPNTLPPIATANLDMTANPIPKVR